MDSEIRILIVEEDPADCELTERALQQAGLVFVARRVDTAEGLRAAMADFAPRVVITDHRLPYLDGYTVVRLVKELSPITPVITLTGSLGEESAVEYIRQGADDYVLKDRMVAWDLPSGAFWRNAVSPTKKR